MTSSAKSADFRSVPHTMNRIDVSTGMDFDEFRSAFEKAAPPVDPAPESRPSNAAAAGMTWLSRRRSMHRTI